MAVARRWTPAEDAVLVANYAEQGAIWPEWATLLPGRGYGAITSRAKRLGVHTRRGPRPRSERDEAPRPATCGACRHYRGDPCGSGTCAERHARGWFGRAPAVGARYDASLCRYGEARA